MKKSIFACIFFLVFSSLANDNINEIKEQLFNGESIKIIRSKLDEVDVAQLNNEDTKLYFQISMFVNMRMNDKDGTNAAAVNFLKLSADEHERIMAVRILTDNVMSKNDDNITGIYDAVHALCPEVPAYIIWFNIFDNLTRNNNKNIVEYAQSAIVGADYKSQKYINYALAIYYSHNGDYAKTEQICAALCGDNETASIFSEKDKMDIEFLLAYALAHQNKYTDAIKILTKMTTYDDGIIKAKAHLILGYCYIGLGDKDKALFHYEQVKKTLKDDKSKLAEEANREIKKIVQ